MERILIIDDDMKIRSVYSNFLKSEGFEILEARNILYGWEIVKRGIVDLILLDIKMLEIEGDILPEIMELFHQKIKIITFSALPISEQMRIMPKASEYFDKSYGIDLLLLKIRKVLYGMS